MNCDQVNEALGAYAVDALPPDERREVEAHLRECSLHPEAAALRATASLLAYAPEEREPSAGLRSRILAAVAETDTTAAPDEPRELFPSAPIPIESRRRRGIPGGGLVAAAVALLALVGFVTGLVLWNGGDGSAELVRTLSSGPAAGTTLRYDTGTDRANLDVNGLAALPAGRVYQVWMLRGEEVSGVGLFTTDPTGRGHAEFNVELRAGDTVAVTEEPAGGSPAPTSQPLFAIQL